VAAELERAGCRDVVDAAYRRFLSVNGDMLATVHGLAAPDGRGGTQVVNDHSDESWDAGVLDRLRALDAAVRPVLEPLCASLERFRGYPERFVPPWASCSPVSASGSPSR
jgi:hypothetical protein